MSENTIRADLMLIHDSQRAFLQRVLTGLTPEMLLRAVSPHSESPSILSVVRHIVNAETYWFHKAGHDILPPIKSDDVQAVFTQLDAVSQRIRETISACSVQQLRVVFPSTKTAPSIAFAVLRTGQHGVYHAGQIAKMRHMIGAPILSPDDSAWQAAVDSIIRLIQDLMEEPPHQGGRVS